MRDLEINTSTQSIITTHQHTVLGESDDAVAMVPNISGSTTQMNAPFAITPFTFDGDLEASRVYQRVRLDICDASFNSSVARTHAWSVFTGISLSAISAVSAIALPLYAEELPDFAWFKMTIVIWTPEPGRIDLQLNPWRVTVQSVKLEVAKHTSIYPRAQVLKFNGRTLEDEQTLDFYGITSDSELQLFALPVPVRLANFEMANDHKFSIYNACKFDGSGGLCRHISNWTGIHSNSIEIVRGENNITNDEAFNYFLSKRGNGILCLDFQLRDGKDVKRVPQVAEITTRQTLDSYIFVKLLGGETCVCFELHEFSLLQLKLEIQEASDISVHSQYIFWKAKLLDECNTQIAESYLHISAVFTFPNVPWSYKAGCYIQNFIGVMEEKCSHCLLCHCHPRFTCLSNFEASHFIETLKPISCETLCRQWLEDYLDSDLTTPTQ
jgi:hypothetical protein